MDVDINILTGDCLETLKTLSDESVQMCVTSPPYYNLRNYGMENQIGIEESPDDYILKLVSVFKEVKRVLKNDGVLWLNIGDSYYNYRPGKGQSMPKQTLSNSNQDLPVECNKRNNKFDNLKEKDLIGIPWMLAFALRNDGWYLRQDIIWSKNNPQPESVEDRCTKSHEYIFLLSKSRYYYYDNVAIKEKSTDPESFKGQRERNAPKMFTFDLKNCKRAGSVLPTGKMKSGQIYEKRNKRSVWNINTHPYKDAHFATFPVELPELCILAGSKIGDTVLDPFNGAGTTAIACVKHDRNYIGCELNPKYVEISNKRIEKFKNKFTLPLLDMMNSNHIKDIIGKSVLSISKNVSNQI